MALFDHLAIALDFSDASRVALRACCRLAELAHVKKITAIHAVRRIVFPPHDQEVVVQRLNTLRERIHGAACTQLRKFCEETMAPHELSVEQVIVEGTPENAIPEKAVELGATILLIGTHSRRGIRRLVFGSVAERIVAGPRIPVLVLPTGEGGVPADVELEALDRVVVAVDGHEETAHIVAETGLEAARGFFTKNPPVTVVSVAELPDFADIHSDSAAGEYRDLVMTTVQNNLAGLIAEFHPTVEVDTRVELGHPADEILRVAEEVEAELVVLGSHGVGRSPFASLGSVTAEVVRRSPVIVLVVPAHPESLSS